MKELIFIWWEGMEKWHCLDPYCLTYPELSQSPCDGKWIKVDVILTMFQDTGSHERTRMWFYFQVHYITK